MQPRFLSLLWVSVLASCSSAQVQNRLSGRLTFEESGTGGYFAATPPETAQLDSATVHTGRRAVRIGRDSLSRRGRTELSFALPSRPAGSMLELRAWLKLENVKGWAGLWLRQADTAAQVKFVNMESDAIAGSSEWREYHLTVPLDPRTQFIHFGAELDGVGIVWVDDIVLLADAREVNGVVAGTLSGKGCAFAGLRGDISAGGGASFEFAFAEGMDVRPDGSGAYRDSVDFVDTYLENSGVRLYPVQQGPAAGVPRRVLSIDLGKPKGSATGYGAQNVNGVVVHWKQDSIRKVISGILDMPIGMTARSERLEIEIYVDGRRHMMRFGDMDLTPCWRNAPDSTGSTAWYKLFGAGTGSATIHRVSADEWVVDLPPGSSGRLWEFFGRPPLNGYAEDRGLYEVGARMTIRRLSVKP